MSVLLAMQNGPSLPFWEEAARIFLVAVLAAAVGVERELREQEAGLRTHILVGVGAALFVIAGTYSWSGLRLGNTAGLMLDPSRVMAYVVTGVGFLGAGAILKNGGGIRGLTTAASLWAVAAIGVTVGAGQYALGILGAAVVLMSLWPVKQIARQLGLRRRRTKRIVVQLDPGTSIADVVSRVEQQGLELESTTLVGENGSRRLEVVLAARADELSGALERLAGAPGVTSASLAS